MGRHSNAKVYTFNRQHSTILDIDSVKN